MRRDVTRYVTVIALVELKNSFRRGQKWCKQPGGHVTRVLGKCIDYSLCEWLRLHPICIFFFLFFDVQRTQTKSFREVRPERSDCVRYELFSASGSPILKRNTMAKFNSKYSIAFIDATYPASVNKTLLCISSWKTHWPPPTYLSGKHHLFVNICIIA